jgi:hypothetical protein
MQPPDGRGGGGGGGAGAGGARGVDGGDERGLVERVLAREDERERGRARDVAAAVANVHRRGGIESRPSLHECVTYLLQKCNDDSAVTIAALREEVRRSHAKLVRNVCLCAAVCRFSSAAHACACVTASVGRTCDSVHCQPRQGRRGAGCSARGAGCSRRCGAAERHPAGAWLASDAYCASRC